MKKLAVATLLFLSGIYHANAQYTDSIINEAPREQTKWQQFKQRLTYGGYGGVVFGTVTNINLSPTIGYRITDKNIIGVGANYIYYSDKRFTPAYTTSVYGGNVFDRQFVTNELFLQAEYQSLNYDIGNGVREWNSYVMAGGGYMPQRGFYITALYILSQPVNSIYGDTPLILRVGVMF